MILHLLKQHTHAYHTKLEQDLDLLRPSLTLDDYRRLLEKMWGFYSPLEEALKWIDVMPERRLMFAGRYKAPLLRQDLRALGLTDETILALPRCYELPRCSTYERALGCWYVLEGATLGGQLIARHLYPRIGVTAEWRGAFFASYGRQVGSMWQDFCRTLTTYALEPTVQHDMVQAACDTFISLDQWLARGEDAGWHDHRSEQRPLPALVQ